MVKRITQRKRSTKRRLARTKKAMTGGLFGFYGKSQRTLEERKPGYQKMFDVLVDKLGNHSTLAFIGGGNDKNSILPIAATLNSINGNKYLTLQKDIQTQLQTVYTAIINNPISSKNNNTNTSPDVCGVCLSIDNKVGVLPLSLLTVKDSIIYYNLTLEFTSYNSQTPINREYIKSQNEGSRRLGGKGGNPKFLYVIGLKPLKPTQHVKPHNPHATMNFAPVSSNTWLFGTSSNTLGPRGPF
jgi:hypothetical protein